MATLCPASYRTRVSETPIVGQNPCRPPRRAHGPLWRCRPGRRAGPSLLSWGLGLSQRRSLGLGVSKREEHARKGPKEVEKNNLQLAEIC